MEGRPGLRTNLDLVNECDNFPHHETDPTAYDARLSTYYAFRLSRSSSTLGYVLPFVAETLRGVPSWVLDDDEGLLILHIPQSATPSSPANASSDSEPGSTHATAAERSAVMASTAAAMRATGAFEVLKGWRDELYPVYGAQGELLFSIERAASPLFGVVTYGVHMTVFTKSVSTSIVDSGGEFGSKKEGREQIKIWVPRRAKTKQTYGGFLDNSVAGGIAAGEPAFECLVREAEEEASLPAELVRRRTKAVGTVSYFHVRDKMAGGEAGFLQPECQFVYDLELKEEDRLELRPSDDEVEGFSLMEVEKVKEALAKGEFKPNCAVVLLDFFIRHGLLDCENEENYIEIVSRIHRGFEFPILRTGRQTPA
ncbi:MAG: hypothetical protein Q9165_005953 [Trypethelium subeluteriae]